MGAESLPNLSQPTALPAAVILDRVRSAYNVGSFFRTGDAAGIRLLYLTGFTAHPPHSKISKTALGAEESLPWAYAADVTEAMGELRGQGYQIAAVETDPDAVDLFDWKPRFPVCLVFGNEVDGLGEDAKRGADVRVRIPMLGVKQSLNVAVAGGAALFEVLRRYREQQGSPVCESPSTPRR